MENLCRKTREKIYGQVVNFVLIVGIPSEKISNVCKDTFILT